MVFVPPPILSRGIPGSLEGKHVLNKKTRYFPRDDCQVWFTVGLPIPCRGKSRGCSIPRDPVPTRKIRHTAQPFFCWGKGCSRNAMPESVRRACRDTRISARFSSTFRTAMPASARRACRDTRTSARSSSTVCSRPHSSLFW